MHPSALLNYEKFLIKYYSNQKELLKVLDVGSYNVNGCLKPSTLKLIPSKYTGLDQEEGPNVDIVGNSHNIPCEDNSYDIVISTSCFEHDDMFWVTFKEMVRVCKSGGRIYINAPSSGPYHGHPGDCWRFYADAWKALERWSSEVVLLESYIDDSEMWKDSVGIYIKK